MKTAKAPVSRFRDPGAYFQCPKTSSSSHKRKLIADLEKGSTSKVNEKEDKPDAVFTWDDYDASVDIEDSWHHHLKRDDGKPIDMEVVEKYLKQVEDSKGFDIIDFPGHIEGITTVIPRQALLNKREYNRDIYVEVVNCASLAIATYNKKHKTDFKVLGIEKLNSQSCKAITYYITFSAVEGKHSEHESHGENVSQIFQFQAKVVNDVIDKTCEVAMCSLCCA